MQVQVFPKWLYSLDSVLRHVGEGILLVKATSTLFFLLGIVLLMLLAYLAIDVNAGGLVRTATPTASRTSTARPTLTSTSSVTPSPTRTFTLTPTQTFTSTPTATASRTLAPLWTPTKKAKGNSDGNQNWTPPPQPTEDDD
jgi:hypothetical protein